METFLPFQADLEPGHRGLQPLHVEGLEDLYQRCLSAQTHSQGLGLRGLQPCSLEDLVQPLPEAQSLPRQALAIEVQLVGSQAQPFDKLGDISIEPFVGRLQAVTHGVELALWKMKTLAVYLRFGVVAADELPAAPHGEGLQQIVKRFPVLFGLDKVAAQAGDAHAGQVVVPVAGLPSSMQVSIPNLVHLPLSDARRILPLLHGEELQPWQAVPCNLLVFLPTSPDIVLPSSEGLYVHPCWGLGPQRFCTDLDGDP